jgi:hypothetical protein
MFPLFSLSTFVKSIAPLLQEQQVNGTGGENRYSCAVN